MTKTGLILAAFILASLLAGCGQKGPLYLPGDPSQIRVNQPEAAESDEEEDDNGQER